MGSPNRTGAATRERHRGLANDALQVPGPGVWDLLFSGYADPLGVLRSLGSPSLLGPLPLGCGAIRALRLVPLPLAWAQLSLTRATCL